MSILETRVSVISRSFIASIVFFFFQAEDGIRDDLVTGVKTCALPISPHTQARSPLSQSLSDVPKISYGAKSTERPVATLPASTSAERITPKVGLQNAAYDGRPSASEIGRASCRERRRSPLAAPRCPHG